MFVRPDSNTIGGNLWFYFKVGNKVKEQHIKLNIVNLTKRNALYL